MAFAFAAVSELQNLRDASLYSCIMATAWVDSGWILDDAIDADDGNDNIDKETLDIVYIWNM